MRPMETTDPARGAAVDGAFDFVRKLAAILDGLIETVAVTARSAQHRQSAAPPAFCESVPVMLTRAGICEGVHDGGGNTARILRAT